MELYRATKKQLETFKRCCRKWQKVLQLNRWSIEVCLNSEKPGDSGSYIAAHCSCLLSAMEAKIFLSEYARERYTNRLLNLFALHECLELMLIPMGADVKPSYHQDQVRHEVINSIIHALVPPE